jgi:hypothetical protein
LLKALVVTWIQIGKITDKIVFYHLDCKLLIFMYMQILFLKAPFLMLPLIMLPLIKLRWRHKGVGFLLVEDSKAVAVTSAYLCLLLGTQTLT